MKPPKKPKKEDEKMKPIDLLRVFIRVFLSAKRAAMNVSGIFVVAIIVAVASVVGLAITANAKDVFDNMALATAANTAMSNTVSTIYTSWPLSGLIVLAMFGAAAIGAFFFFKGVS